MKTIKDELDSLHADENEEFFFIKGVEFAQRWISFKEEEPTEYPCNILLKNNDKIYCDSRIFANKEQFCNVIRIHKYTHWRPIERV